MLYIMKSTVSSKGQVTLPVAARRALGLSAGTSVEFEIRDGELVLRKGGASRHPVDGLFGVLSNEAPVDDLLDEMRGPRPKGKRGSRPGSA